MTDEETEECEVAMDEQAEALREVLPEDILGSMIATAEARQVYCAAGSLIHPSLDVGVNSVRNILQEKKMTC